jgi:hypothetical protein
MHGHLAASLEEMLRTMNTLSEGILYVDMGLSPDPP